MGGVHACHGGDVVVKPGDPVVWSPPGGGNITGRFVRTDPRVANFAAQAVVRFDAIPSSEFPVPLSEVRPMTPDEIPVWEVMSS